MAITIEYIHFIDSLILIRPQVYCVICSIPSTDPLLFLLTQLPSISHKIHSSLKITLQNIPHTYPQLNRRLHSSQCATPQNCKLYVYRIIEETERSRGWRHASSYTFTTQLYRPLLPSYIPLRPPPVHARALQYTWAREWGSRRCGAQLGRASIFGSGMPAPLYLRRFGV